MPRDFISQELLLPKRQELQLLLVAPNHGQALLTERAIAGMAGEGRLKIATVCSGEEGLARIDGDAVDVCLLDVELGEGQVFRFLRTLRAWGSAVPVILLAPPDSVSVTARALTEGARDFLTKGSLGPELVLRSIHYAAERARLESSLSRERRRHRRLFENNVAGSFRLSAEGELLDCNPAFLRLLGSASKQEVRGQELLQLVLPQAWNEVDFEGAGLPELRGGRTVRLRREDGSTILVRMQTVVEERGHGEIEAIEGTVVPLGSQPSGGRAPYRFAGSESTDPTLLGAARDLDDVAAAVVGYADLLLEELQSEGPRRQLAREVRIAGVRAVEIARQLMAFQTPRRPSRTILNPTRVVGDLERSLARATSGRELRLRLDPKCPRIRISFTDLEAILTGLVDVACDCSREGPLTVATQRVEIGREGTTWRMLGLLPGTYTLLRVSDALAEERDSDWRGQLGGVGEVVAEGSTDLSELAALVEESSGRLWVARRPGFLAQAWFPSTELSPVS